MGETLRNTLNGAEAMVRSLEAHGVRHIFGLCGDTTLPFYDAMHNLDHNITHVLTRDERSATYMADAYARVTGRVGVCEGPSGGGATYILPGLIEANESSYAVLSITTDISVASYGKYPLTEVDQEALMRPLTKFNTVIRRADHIPRMVRQAFRAMTTGRSGSSHLGLPYDIQYDPVPVDDIWGDPKHQTFPAYRVAPEPGSVGAAVEAVLTAKSPLIVCGGGVVISGAMEDLDRLASRLDLAVASSVSGKGSLADTHPLSLGVVGSNGGTDETWEMMEAADLVIFMGCRAGSTTTSRWEAPKPGQRIVHFDSDPMTIGANYPTEVGVVGDLKLALAEANAYLGTRDGDLPSFGGAAKVADIRERKFARFQALVQTDAELIIPEQIIDTLNKNLPDDAIVVSDPGTSCPYYNAYSQQKHPGRQYITNRAHGALGYSLSAAIGAWYGRPGSKVVAMMGDGSFAFACGELETVVRANAPITYIVFSNSAFGWIKASQYADCDKRYYNVDFNRTNQAAVAAAFGLKTWKVEKSDDLDRVMKEAFAHDGPTLIDVICQPLEEAAAPVRRWMG